MMTYQPAAQVDDLVDEEFPLLFMAKDQDTTYSQHPVRTMATSDSDETCSVDSRAKVLGSYALFEAKTKESQQEESSQPQDGSVEDAATLMEGVVEEAQDILEAIMEELHEADKGDLHFLEMGLTRNLSILPGDMVDAASFLNPPSQVPTAEPHGDLEAQKKKEEQACRPAIPLSAYLLLLSAVISLSSIGPLLQLQQNVTPTMKIVWRMACTTILLLPLAAMDIRKHGFPSLTAPQWMTFLLSTACYSVMTVSFVISLEYTAVGNAVILSNSLALILLLGKLCMGDPVTLLEGGGAMLAFGGAVLCSKDSAEARSSAPTSGLLGDAFAILSAIGGVGYLVFAKTSRQHMSLYLFIFLTMSVGTLMILLFQILVLGETVTWDRDPNHGVWGFLIVGEADRLPLEVTMVVVCNFFGSMGYVRAMQYFDNLVISSAMLLEPVAAEFMACFVGVGSLPGLQGWLGIALVALGTLAVIYKANGGKSVQH
jgi:drug/metabolite transporter (DMT)-like permease